MLHSGKNQNKNSLPTVLSRGGGGFRGGRRWAVRWGRWAADLGDREGSSGAPWMASPIWKTSDFVVVSLHQQQVPVCRMVWALAAGQQWPWVLAGSPSPLCLLESTSGDHPGRSWAAHPGGIFQNQGRRGCEWRAWGGGGAEEGGRVSILGAWAATTPPTEESAPLNTHGCAQQPVGGGHPQ